MKNHIKMISALVVVLALLGIIGVYLTTCNDQRDVTNQAMNSKAYYHLGDTAVTGEIALTMLQAGIFENNEYYGIERGYRLYGVYIKVSNITDEQVYFDDCDLMAYSNGVQCDPYLFVDDSIGSFYLDDNQNRYGWLYYIVPKNAKNISVEYTWDTLSDYKIIFKVK